MNTEPGSSPTGRPAESSAGCAVVVPIFNAVDHVRQCLEALLTKTPEASRLVLVDDASTDPDIGMLLTAAGERDPRVRIVSNPVNRGYTAAVNLGVHRSGSDHVVVLNSDTRVTGGWLDGMLELLRARPDAATITPVSNAAGAFSVPERGRRNRLPDGWTPDDMAALVRAISPGRAPEVPTGNGFCMLMSRRAIADVGAFDETGFPRGYGEENDFCCRATRAGYVHLADDRTFVYHALAASHGAWRRAWLVRLGGWRLRRRYPDYRDRVARWLADDPIDELRATLRRELESAGGNGG
jgi:GT2 family glycosyltransferase